MKFFFAATLLLLSVFGTILDNEPLSQTEEIEQIIKQTILTPMEDLEKMMLESMPKMDDMEIEETAITRHAQMVEANKEYVLLLENREEVMLKALENEGASFEVVEARKAMFEAMKKSSEIPSVEEIVKSIKEGQEMTMKMMNDFSKMMTDMEKSLPIVMKQIEDELPIFMKQIENEVPILMKQLEDDYESMAKDLFEGFNDEDMADSMKYLFGDDDSFFGNLNELEVEDNLEIQEEKLDGAKNRLEQVNLFESQEKLDLNNNDYALLENENEDHKL